MEGVLVLPFYITLESSGQAHPSIETLGFSALVSIPDMWRTEEQSLCSPSHKGTAGNSTGCPRRVAAGTAFLRLHKWEGPLYIRWFSFPLPVTLE